MKYVDFLVYVRSDIRKYNELRYRRSCKNFRWIQLLSFRVLPVFLLRLSLYLHAQNHVILSGVLKLILFHLYSLEFSSQITIRRGLFIGHTVGVVLGAREIGSNCIISGMCSIGSKEMDVSNNSDLRPVIADNVTIGSGSRILGPIKICRDVVIGANAVVPFDIMVPGLYLGVPVTRHE